MMITFMNRFCKKNWLSMLILGGFCLLNVSIAKAEITLFTTNQAEWDAMVADMELFTTIPENIALADEVSSLPGLNAYLGPTLTFQAANTGLSRGFMLETLQPGAGFTFNDTEGGVPVVALQNALSVGDTDDYEDDDWQLSLVDGPSMMAFGVEIRHARFAPGEGITLYSGADLVGTVDLSSLPSVGDENYFIGIVSDIPFDRIGFNEDPDGDDIGIADFRFANAAAMEICSNLGNNKFRILPDLDVFTIQGTAGEEVTVYLDVNPAGTSTGNRTTLALKDGINTVRYFKIERNGIPNEITAVLPATGMYYIAVVEQPRFMRGQAFRGDYCLTVESSGGASETLAPTALVE